VQGTWGTSRSRARPFQEKAAEEGRVDPPNVLCVPKETLKTITDVNEFRGFRDKKKKKQPCPSRRPNKNARGRVVKWGKGFDKETDLAKSTERLEKRGITVSNSQNSKKSVGEKTATTKGGKKQSGFSTHRHDHTKKKKVDSSDQLVHNWSGRWKKKFTSLRLQHFHGR